MRYPFALLPVVSLLAGAPALAEPTHEDTRYHDALFELLRPFGGNDIYVPTARALFDVDLYLIAYAVWPATAPPDIDSLVPDMVRAVDAYARSRHRRAAGWPCERNPFLIFMFAKDNVVRKAHGPEGPEGLNGYFASSSTGFASIMAVSVSEATATQAIMAHQMAHFWDTRFCLNKTPEAREAFAQGFTESWLASRPAAPVTDLIWTVGKAAPPVGEGAPAPDIVASVANEPTSPASAPAAPNRPICRPR